MNETGANYQQIAKELTSKQLNISVDHGIRNQRDPNYHGGKRMNELNQEATSAREGFRRLVKESAKILGKIGFAPEVMARSRRAMAVASWGTRGERVINHLETYNQRPDTRNDKVWKTLDELDKKINVRMCDKDGKITMRPVRESMGLTVGDTPEYREIVNAQFPEAAGKPGYIIIDGQAFSRSSLLSTLDGHQKMKPTYDPEGYVTVPVKNNKGQLYCLRFKYEQIVQIESGVKAQKAVEASQSKEQPFDPNIVVSGGASLSAPDHGLQDMHDNYQIMDQAGNPIARREVVVDGSGGSLNGFGYDQPTQDRLIGEKMKAILGGIRNYSDETPASALQKASNDAKSATAVVDGTTVENPAYGTGLVCDFTPEGISVANAGDVACLLWKENPFANKRNPSVFRNQSGGSGRFQLQNMMHNEAQALKDVMPQIMPTKQLDETSSANRIYRQVGEGQVQVDNNQISPEELVNEQPEFALIFSDGGRPGSNLLVDSDSYSSRVSQILTDLKSGKINGATRKEQLNNASMMIVEAARNIAGDTDDITVRVIDIREYVKWCQQKTANQKH